MEPISSWTRRWLSMPLKAPHLRQASSADEEEGNNHEEDDESLASEATMEPSVVLAPISCTLGVHDEAFSKEEILVNPAIFPKDSIPKPGIRLKIVPEELTSPRATLIRQNSDHVNSLSFKRSSTRGSDGWSDDTSFVFILRALASEILSKHSNLEVSISQKAATALGLTNGIRVTVTMAEKMDHTATHVEIAFRDSYLTRADMWRLMVSELANKSIYKGQRLIFTGSIKAQVRKLYLNGRKLPSAYVGPHTKVIFRSESARIIIFIQMSREMWEFDIDGTGDIMFDKAITGFLPELFRRWQEGGVSHLVTIILFTRLEYDCPMDSTFSGARVRDDSTASPNQRAETPYKDFYQVLLRDMPSAQWSDMLDQLRQQFTVFLRDVSIRPGKMSDYVFCFDEEPVTEPRAPKTVIDGHATPAIQGNLLEAINLAASQISDDYVDRDLTRTGLSIMVVTPGPGIFEVDYNLLAMTTDTLLANRIGVDLVCLSRLPLHSVPVFLYKPPQSSKTTDPALRLHGLTSNAAGGAGSDPPTAKRDQPVPSIPRRRLYLAEDWIYAVPSWVDVSFWNANAKDKKDPNKTELKRLTTMFHKPFIPRARMYEVQMMGIMENEMCDIAIPLLPPLPPPLSLDFADQGHLSASAQGSPTNSRIPQNADSPVGSFQSTFSPDSPNLTDEQKALAKWMDDYDDQVFTKPRPAYPMHKDFDGLPDLPPLRFTDEPSVAKAESAFDDMKGGKPSKWPLATPSPKSSFLSRATMETSSLSTQMQLSPLTRIEKPPPLSTNKSSSSTRSTATIKPASKPEQASNKLEPASKPEPALKPASTAKSTPMMKSSQPSRQFSSGFAGFGGLASKAAPVTKVSSEIAISEPLNRRTPPLTTQASALSEAGPRGEPSASKSSQVPKDLAAADASKPIPIRSPDGRKPMPVPQLASESSEIMTDHSDEGDKKELGAKDPETSKILADSTEPWLILSHPFRSPKKHFHPLRRYKTWQHIFPRPLNATAIKWKSMCAPASLPLTTEDFPSPDILEAKFSASDSYVVKAQVDEAEMIQPAGWLLREVISARFSHGFQLAIGPRIEEAFPHLSTNVSLLNDSLYRHSGSSIFMIRGKVIHLLTVLNEGAIKIEEWLLKPGIAFASRDAGLGYQAFVRTTLTDQFQAREHTFDFVVEEKLDWQRLDDFLSAHEEQVADSYPESVQFSRARFVLIPMDLPSSNRQRVQPKNEDNTEEVRLEGISKLTQLWQRNRFIPSVEKRFQNPARKRKDPNPLDIIFRTLNPAAIVASELNDATLLTGESTDGKPAQLLPDSDLYERANLNLASLAQTIQSERGVNMMDRRWHWRYHYNCFIGMELTTWLLHNFRDVDTPCEAVELGNELMKEGLFQHVEKRHNFRDGNYFYQIAAAFRVPRNEKNWFRRITDRSVPTTPLSEPPRAALRSRASSTGDGESGSDATSSKSKLRLGVTLSKKLIYDVDHRKRSYRKELVTLHYDRISSADDCYHLRLDWVQVTPKLIEESIISWAIMAERFGLRLVELPIVEACRVNEFHPFRAPCIITPALAPPTTQPTGYFSSTSQVPHAPARLPYHAAILKKFNFVLDLEAASDFPALVAVAYSWGRPEYRYPQYVSREGVLLAQIMPNGDLLLLPNRLYNNRSAAAREVLRSARAAPMDHDNPCSQGRHGQQSSWRSPARGTTMSGFGSRTGTPSASHIMRIAGSALHGADWKMAAAIYANAEEVDAPAAAIDSDEDDNAPAAKPGLPTPEQIKDELAAFCQDKVALEKFYDDFSAKLGLTGPPSTPAWGGEDARLEMPPSGFSLRGE